jgi:hypothetical protein
VEVNVVVDDVAGRDEPDLLKVRASVYVGVADPRRRPPMVLDLESS